MTGTDHMTDHQENATCTEDCAFNTYLRYLPRLVAGGNLHLVNEDNVSVGIYDSEGNVGFGVSIAYMHIDAGEWSGKDHMAPRVWAMYERIRKDMDTRDVKYTEAFERIL